MLSFYRTFFLFIPFLITVSTGSHAQKPVAEHARAIITPLLMKQSIDYLASDSMKGRETPSAGLDSSGAFIARQFKSFGLLPLNGSYFQDLLFCQFSLDSNNFLSVVNDLQTLNFILEKDFVPYDISGSKSAEGKIVFAGYGITAPEYDYDDYKDIDVKGHIVVVLRQEPGQIDFTQKKFKGIELTHYAGLKEKQKMAQDHGAAALLVMSEPLNHETLNPKGFIWPAPTELRRKNGRPIGFCGSPEERIPMVLIGESVINELFGKVDTVRVIQQRIEKNMQPNSFIIPGKTLAMNVSLTGTPVGGRNVIAFLEGSDPGLKSEAVIIGGHYDHLGYLREHQTGTDYIYNGADDNASGTSGVLAAARAFGSMDEKPKRSIIFMAFAGEEKGLLGSATYMKQPLWPVNKTVAMLNLDMIGRNYPDSLEVIGAKQNPGIWRIIRRQNRRVGFILAESKGKRMNEGSDHYNFFRNGIPAVYFFTGFHQDYHKVTDNPDRINSEKAARVARLAFLTAWSIANNSAWFKIKKLDED